MKAISLAVERQIPAVLIDDRKGWLAAEARHIIPVGTINILEAAASRGLLDFENAIADLTSTNFRIDPAIITLARERVANSSRS